MSELPLQQDEASELLLVEPSAPPLRVRQWQRWRWLTLGDSRTILQGVQQLDHPELPQLPYAVAMLSALLLQPEPGLVLNLGLGCGSFERFICRFRPPLQLTTVERDPRLATVARDYFGLPPEVALVNADAAAFLAKSSARFDLLLCDLHDGKAQPLVHQAAFCAALLARLSRRGVLALNLLESSEAELVALLLRLRRQRPALLLIEPPYSRNLVLLAARQLPDSATLSRRAAQLQADSGLDLGPCLAASQRLPLPAGG